MWPLEVTQVEYFTHAADLPMAAAARRGANTAPGCACACARRPGSISRQLALEDLRLHCAGIDDVAVSAARAGLRPRHRRARAAGAAPGRRGTRRWTATASSRAGFDDDEALLPPTLHGFQGYRLLQEYFAFPQRFLFFDLCGLGAALRARGGSEVDIVHPVLDAPTAALLQSVDAWQPGACTACRRSTCSSKRCDRIHVDPDQCRVPRRARPHAADGLRGALDDRGTGLRRRRQATSSASCPSTTPSTPKTAATTPTTRCSASRACCRRCSSATGRAPRTSAPRCSCRWSTPTRRRSRPDLRQIGVRALCTNRDLPLLMPVGQRQGRLHPGADRAGAESISVHQGPVAARVGAGAKATRLEADQPAVAEPPVAGRHGRRHRAPRRCARSLRLYAPSGDAGCAAQVDGVRSVQMQPVVRRLPMPGPITFGRGVDDHASTSTTWPSRAPAPSCSAACSSASSPATSRSTASPRRGCTRTAAATSSTGRPRCGTRPIL